MYFCELCRLYLPRLDQPERALSIHCRTRTHLQRYVRYRDDRALRNKAEKIHHRKEVAKENAAKEAEAKKNLEEKTEGQDEVSEFQNILHEVVIRLMIYHILPPSEVIQYSKLCRIRPHFHGKV